MGDTAPQEELLAQALEVVVVNDGSTGCEAVFAALEPLSCTVLHHPHNCGKGRALKTGFAWMAEHGFEAAVTADADGQHTARDILRVAQAMEQAPGKLVLGARDVDQMPGRSRFGNSLTRKLFALLYSVRISDTQTGLRGVPLAGEGRVQRLLDMEGERYEYEMNMLVFSAQTFDGIVEVPIETIYIGENESSHFRPIKDGMKIYSVLLRRFPRFFAASLLSAVLDYGLFAALYYLLLGNAALSTLGARVVSASFNYLVNKRLVFRSDSDYYTPLRYFGLAVAILALNAALMFVFADVLRFPALLVKVPVECGLYCLSFVMQNNWAHRGKKKQ